ncbi:hypothetical protein NK553_13365 [Pseudomonas sp. ZM23]|uniref:PH domain-containing protein n=1 Tax=Pseudomonas triclosanedens TaxID=2961893 RepID=A0ABY7A525_9PSED|nr:hypothetical protein [Pseudomonas triclosanedens]MCP8464937.1 hypothetical protein [Pseudomonas triclosanedens]MCP8470351.1 hypothetical protein [Pseudomonas triclosanedens]MCP8476156.1 hypothetical protein [Pseudomonas triclosanedens]WAI51611.1 hypothetical protein OU419_10290 [Pseudomonas triclosanedens]
MDVRLLSRAEFDNVHFYRAFTLLILLALVVFALIKLAAGAITLFSPVPLILLVMVGRFAVEWLRVAKCEPAFIDKGELVLCNESGFRRIPLTSIRAVRSRHSLFMVRRYRSWSEHLAFLDFTLNNGERVHTLTESGVFEFPAGTGTLRAVEAAILEAKTQSLARRQQEATGNDGAGSLR